MPSHVPLYVIKYLDAHLGKGRDDDISTGAPKEEGDQEMREGEDR
jgi:hypothetical protein